MKGFGIHGSITNHGGIVLSTQSRSSQMGILFLRAGDGHFCPRCKCWSTLMKSNDHVIIDGKAVAFVGDKLSCGATLMPKQSHVVGDSGSSTLSSFQSVTNAQQNDNFIDNAIKKNGIVLKDLMVKPFIPLGSPKPDGSQSNDNFIFYGSTVNAIFEAIVLEIKKDGKFVEVKRIDGLFSGSKEFQIKWDGFVQDVYDSKFMTDTNGIDFIIKGINGGQAIAFDENNFKFKYFNKDWMDVLINKVNKKININLRINLQDGGEQGLEAWKYIPATQILHGIPPIKSRNIAFERLKTIALEGMKYYWSRNSSHLTGKNISLKGDDYEVFLTAKESVEKAMPSMSLTFSTNWRPARSANWELYRNTFYNTGYMLFNTERGAIWQFWEKAKADKSFKLTFAHEMGHELLLAFAGQKFSKGHKCTSGIIFQSPISGTRYPRTGEIDLMKYADENENNINLFHERSVASKEDVAGLLFISGISKK